MLTCYTRPGARARQAFAARADAHSQPPLRARKLRPPKPSPQAGGWGNRVSPFPNRWWERLAPSQAGVRFDRLTAGGETRFPHIFTSESDTPLAFVYSFPIRWPISPRRPRKPIAEQVKPVEGLRPPKPSPPAGYFHLRRGSAGYTRRVQCSRRAAEAADHSGAGGSCVPIRSPVHPCPQRSPCLVAQRCPPGAAGVAGGAFYHCAVAHRRAVPRRAAEPALGPAGMGIARVSARRPRYLRADQGLSS